jgi:cytochrome b561
MQRYDRVARALHWGLALLLIGQIVFGFSLDAIAPRGTPNRSLVINLHKSCGMVLLLLILLRLGWRLRHAPPSWPALMSTTEQMLATWGHRLLYAVMVALPLAGLVASNFSKHGVKFFNLLLLPPLGPDLPAVYRLFNGLHVALALTLTVLVIGHVAAALRHALRRDGVFQRMGPLMPKASESKTPPVGGVSA